MAEPSTPRPGDTVSWKGASGDRLIGVLVAFSRGGKPVVRRWIASKGQFGKPQTVEEVSSAPMSEWG
jgi:hypothetical protein